MTIADLYLIKIIYLADNRLTTVQLINQMGIKEYFEILIQEIG